MCIGYLALIWNTLDGPKLARQCIHLQLSKIRTNKNYDRETIKRKSNNKSGF